MFHTPVPPGPPLSKSMSQMSSCAEFLSFFFFFLEGSYGGFSRDSSSDLLMSEMGISDGWEQEEHESKVSFIPFECLSETHYLVTKAARTEGYCNQRGQEKLTECLTDLRHCLEDHTGEADSHFDGFHIGELQQQRFVLGCVA